MRVFPVIGVLFLTAAAVIAEIPQHRAGDVSRFVHESEGRCRGFFAFTTRAEAEAFLRNDLAARAVTESFLADYTIDNQATVGPWLQQVEEAQIRASIQHLSTAYPNRYYASPYGENAAVWIHDTWLALADGREDVSAELLAGAGWRAPLVEAPLVAHHRRGSSRRRKSTPTSS